MTKTEYNRLKKRQRKENKLQERAWKGTAQSYSGIMFGPVLERRTRMERFRQGKPSLNIDGKPSPIASVGHSLTLIKAIIYPNQVERRGQHNREANRLLQAQADRIRARLPVTGI